MEMKSTRTSFERAAIMVATVLKMDPIIMAVLLLIKCIPSVITNKAGKKLLNASRD